MLFVADATVFVAGGTVFVAGGMLFVVDGTVLATDGAVSLQNRQPAARPTAAHVTFSLHLGKAPAPSRCCLVY